MGMNQETFRDIPARVADDNVLPARLHRALETEMLRKELEGKLIILSDEEVRMVRSFRRFRSLARKAGAVFTWQTTPDERAIVPGEESPLIVDPMTEPALVP